MRIMFTEKLSKMVPRIENCENRLRITLRFSVSYHDAVLLGVLGEC